MGLFGREAGEPGLLGRLFKRRDQRDDAVTYAPPPSLEELIEARDKLTRQIEILAVGPVNQRDATPMSAVLSDELRNALAEIEEAIARLDSAGSQSDDRADLGAGDTPNDDDDDSDVEAAAELLDPAVLDAFDGVVTNVARGADGGLWISYLVICRHCTGGDTFTVTATREIVPDPSPYNEYQPGDVIDFAPYAARCIQCGAKATLFDPDVSGRASVLNPAPVDDGAADDRPASESAPGALTVSLLYQGQLDELRTLAASAGVSPGDLFDLIHIRSVSPHGQPVFEEQYRCSESDR